MRLYKRVCLSVGWTFCHTFVKFNKNQPSTKLEPSRGRQESGRIVGLMGLVSIIEHALLTAGQQVASSRLQCFTFYYTKVIFLLHPIYHHFQTNSADTDERFLNLGPQSANFSDIQNELEGNDIPTMDEPVYGCYYSGEPLPFPRSFSSPALDSA